jgi:hypothetical protein
MPGDESISAARARPGNSRDFKEESNAANAKDGRGLRGISGRVGNPQATTGAPTKWDNEKAAYVAAHGATHHAAHGATHHAAHGRGECQGLPALPALFGSTAEKNFQGKTGQRGSAANFFPAQERQHNKRLLSPMASVGGPIPIVKGCRRCLVLPRRKFFRIAGNDKFVSKERGHEPDDN